MDRESMMQALTPTQPHKIITWKDTENTGATGWIVIHNLVNGVSGGGLFMHESASLQEVKDLACSMRYKNALLQPMIGGGKGGIKFNANDPRAKSVLKRFLKDNVDTITAEWCTGGDINTTTEEITQLLSEVSPLKSPFHCLANLLENELNIRVNIKNFNKNLQCTENKYFTVDQAITGYSIFKMIEEKVINEKPKVIVQGFGKVGRAFCYYAKAYCNIVGICERDWYIYDENGIDIESLLSRDASILHDGLFNINDRDPLESEENFLQRFLSQARADIFCPCAIRYCINQEVLDVLINQTFMDTALGNAFIIAGANDIFKEKDLISQAFAHNITVIPEWLSNPGSAILFVEALQYRNTNNNWQAFIKLQVADRIKNFMSKATAIANLHQLNIYEACCFLAHNTIENSGARARSY
jgi:glutamate dehydrogenase (NAD(P)+)